MKAFALLSGGKDSFLSAQIAMEQGYEIEGAISVIPREFSMMFHYPNAARAKLVAELLGVEWIPVPESNVFENIAKMCRGRVDALISGAIASDYQKTRIEKMCTEAGIISYSPLWRKSQKRILEEIIMRGIQAIIVSVSAEGFDMNDLGRLLDSEYVSELERKNSKYGINIAGEGGEYETFVLGTKHGKLLEIKKSRKIWEGSHGYLLIDDAIVSRHPPAP